MNFPKIAITVGDPSGVGPEVIRKWALENSPLLQFAEVIGHRSFLETLPESLSKREVGPSSYVPLPGLPDDAGARVAKSALEAAARGCADSTYGAVVTAPISKYQMKRVGFNYPGHTEFFASEWGGEPVMAFAGKKLITALATWHIPLRDVPSALNKGNILRAAKSLSDLTKVAKGIQTPRIAVCGLNPHAGEGGILGDEEIKIINPILESARNPEGLDLSECLPPDTVFERVLRGEFDCALAMYHDQALAPLKALEFDEAVNVTMNLPFVRTSPDHGTGFSIAGKQIASAGSFSAAFDLAVKLVKSRL